MTTERSTGRRARTRWLAAPFLALLLPASQSRPYDQRARHGARIQIPKQTHGTEAWAIDAGSILSAMAPTPGESARKSPPTLSATPLRTGAESEAELSVPGEASRQPAALGTALFRAESGRPQVAITFDDGPNPRVTPAILRILADHSAHATFFVLGNRVEAAPDLVAAMFAAGHEIGNHSFSHRSFRGLFPSQLAEELARTDRAVETAIGQRPRFVRPPFGRFTTTNLDYLTNRGNDIVLWSVDSTDWAASTCDDIAASVLRATRPGSIILLHDHDANSACALHQILGGLKQRGLTPVTVSELVERPAYQP